MTKQQARAYLIGIDLGTTHTVVAYQPVAADPKQTLPQIFEIDQLLGPGEVGKRPLLPSFRYHAMAEEFAAVDMQLPWTNQPVAGDIPDVIIGEWARELGSRTEGRQVVSAKSWLSHQGVDRNADILPWAGSEGVAKVSPVVASASYLQHIRQAWDYAYPHQPMAKQHVVVTIPASFDEGARALTVAAAKLAGLPQILLLEEPQAVVYDWYLRNQAQAAQLLTDIPLLLVADVGGGTTDLSLIAVQQQPEFTLTRIGVGDHLMLGGDNIDFALAHQVEQQLQQTQGGKNTALKAASLSTLIQQTRKVKEQLLVQQAQASAKVTLLGSGSRLIGASRSVAMTKEQVQQLALDGFFPQVASDAQVQQRQTAMVEFGLPYVADPAISRHLAAFIQQHQPACRKAMGHKAQDYNETPQHLAIPPAVLLNGGVFNSPLIRQRVLQQFSHWADEEITELDNPYPDLAVAFGAVAYAAARRGKMLRIGGGSPRSYFLRLDDDKVNPSGICLLPKGRDEGDEVALQEQQFLLTLGQPVKFNLLSTSADRQFAAGEIVPLTLDSLIELPPLILTLTPKSTEALTQPEKVPVSLACQLTEVGTLLIQCVSLAVDSSPYYGQRWRLEFEVRQSIRRQANADDNQGREVYQRLTHALALINEVYGSSQKVPDNKKVKRLRIELEKLLGKRDNWQTAMLRELATGLLNGRKRRRRSQQHEQNWLRLTGYCMRPGFGFAADEWRMEQIWGLYQQNIQFKTAASWGDWWTFWRRVAGGLTLIQQQQIYKDLVKYVQPGVLRNNKLMQQASERSYQEMVRLLASLEKLPVDTKVELVGWLSQRVQRPQHAQVHWWAIGRIAARMPFAGTSHTLITPEYVQEWLADIVQIDWQSQPEIAFAAVMMSIKTGDRTRDIDEQSRQQVLQKLAESKMPPSWLQLVGEVKTLTEDESKRFFGEALPAGLRLL